MSPRIHCSLCAPSNGGLTYGGVPCETRNANLNTAHGKRNCVRGAQLTSIARERQLRTNKLPWATLSVVRQTRKRHPIRPYVPRTGFQKRLSQKHGNFVHVRHTGLRLLNGNVPVAREREREKEKEVGEQNEHWSATACLRQRKEKTSSHWKTAGESFVSTLFFATPGRSVVVVASEWSIMFASLLPSVSV